MDVRIKSAAGTSNVFTLKVTPYLIGGIVVVQLQQDGMLSTAMVYNAETGTYSISWFDHG
jgi:hypothetical protein